MAVEPRWDAVRTDGVWHAVYWIAEWPRVEVTPDFLGPLLFAPLRRSLSLVMEPVGPVRAARQVAQSRTADLADGELRRRGRVPGHRASTPASGRASRRGTTELADGHAQFRFSAYLTVTADSRGELTAACAALEQAAGQSRLEVRLLYGQQDAALLCGRAGRARSGVSRLPSRALGPRGDDPPPGGRLSAGQRGRPRARGRADRPGPPRRVVRLRPVRPLPGRAWSPIPTWWSSGRSAGARARS